jgi:hypothetical protein
VILPRPTEEVLPGGSTSEPWDPGDGAEAIEIDYQAGGAHATVDGAGELTIAVDGDERTIEVGHPGLYDLASHPAHESHRLVLCPSRGVRVWSVSFSPGVRA